MSHNTIVVAILAIIAWADGGTASKIATSLALAACVGADIHAHRRTA